MIERFLRAWRLLLSVFGDHHSILLENLALRQQLAIYQRTVPRPRLRRRDRLFWMGLSRWWRAWKSALIIVRPETVLAWHTRRFRRYWTTRSAADAPDPVAVHFETTLVQNCLLCFQQRAVNAFRFRNAPKGSMQNR